MKSLSMLPLALLIGGATLLGGCKLSDLNDDDDDDGPTVVLQGRAAVGGPMIGATIDIKDADGREFRVYSDASGYFSLTLDDDDVAPRFIAPATSLTAPIIVRADYNESTYHSVLCNIVYGERDSVNVHPLTQYVMNSTATVASAYANWTDGASDDYCNAAFNDVFRDTAATLGSPFNFFNSAFSANGSGFDATLASFNPATFDRGTAAEGFHIANGLGSLVLIPGTVWSGTVSGKFGEDTIEEMVEQELDVDAAGLRSLVEELLAGYSRDSIEIESLTAVVEGDGTGEAGTTFKAVLKGKAAINGLSVVTRSFNITMELERIVTPGDGPA